MFDLDLRGSEQRGRGGSCEWSGQEKIPEETGTTEDVEAGIISKEEQEEPCRGHRQSRNSHFQQSCLPVVLSLMEFNHIFNEQIKIKNKKITESNIWLKMWVFFPLMFGSRDYVTQVLLRCLRCLPRGEVTDGSLSEQVKQKKKQPKKTFCLHDHMESCWHHCRKRSPWKNVGKL